MGITEVAKLAGVKEADVKKVFEAVKTAAATDTVQVRGFGSFKTAIRAARKGRNPQTGAEIEIPEKSVLTFKSSK